MVPLTQQEDLGLFSKVTTSAICTQKSDETSVIRPAKTQGQDKWKHISNISSWHLQFYQTLVKVMRVSADLLNILNSVFTKYADLFMQLRDIFKIVFVLSQEVE